MLVKTIENKESGRKWEIYKKSDDEYFYKYFEFFRSCGWRLIDQDGGHEQGFYWSKDAIEWEFEIKIA